MGTLGSGYPGYQDVIVTSRIIIYSINHLDLAGNYYYYLVGDYHIYTIIIMILHFATITDNLDTRKQKIWLATFV